MISVVVILRYLSKGCQRLESTFLDPPHFPVTVTSGHDLIIVFGVESEALDSLVVLLLGEFKVSYDPILKEVFTFLRVGFFTNWLNPRVDQSLNIPVSIRIIRY